MKRRHAVTGNHGMKERICIILALALVSLLVRQAPAAEPGSPGCAIVSVIDESQDVAWEHTGFPDPFVFEQDGYFYLFGTSRRCFRTRTFEQSDLTRYQLTLDTSLIPNTLDAFWAFRVYRHTDGAYHGYATLFFNGYDYIVLGHFVPTPGQQWDTQPILQWTLDGLIVQGTPDKPVYDSNVVRDDSGIVYLVYNQELEDGNVHIMAWRMLDPRTTDPGFAPRAILSPEGYRSEDRNPGYIQIVESTIIQKIQGKYVLLYSVGDYDLGNYKIGVAYSEVLVPPTGQRYQKVLIPDPSNVWGNLDKGSEIQYLLQTQISEWPNYVADCVNGPGIGNIVEVGSQYYLVFHAREPGITGLSGWGRYVWKVPLRINIAGNRPMNTWIEAETAATDTEPKLPAMTVPWFSWGPSR